MSNLKTLEVFGEGKTDIGKVDAPGLANSGVVPILVHTLCGKPANMRVRRHSLPFLQRKRSLWQKVKFAKQQASVNGSAAAIVVVDTEGDRKTRIAELAQGRNACLPNYPMAVGTAHPCIETWLLADPVAIAKGLGLGKLPTVPDRPEELSAPHKNRNANPKTALAAFSATRKSELSAAEKDQIALAIKDMNLVRARCPLGFAPFADEVEQHIKPLFVHAQGDPHSHQL
ncbi:MAG TPA: hypothetical protein VE988_28735 [Gemmataceae bacterium]|nr:hypothetical protein [Gemmataceae bacterium]